jgi:hypothetical protein
MYWWRLKIRKCKLNLVFDTYIFQILFYFSQSQKMRIENITCHALLSLGFVTICIHSFCTSIISFNNCNEMQNTLRVWDKRCLHRMGHIRVMTLGGLNLKELSNAVIDDLLNGLGFWSKPEVKLSLSEPRVPKN